MRLQIILGIIGALAFLSFGILQLCAGYVGIDYHLGAVWAVIAVILAVIFRFTLPITIGAFFGALHVWHWPFIFAILFVAPGLIFIIPGVLIMVISKLKNLLYPQRKNPQDVVIEAVYIDQTTKTNTE